MIARNLKLGLAAALVLLASCGGGGGSDPSTEGPPNPNTGEAASILFSTVNPPVIAVRGFGKVESTILRFLVRNAQGNAAADGITVNFTLSGPGNGKSIASGGEYIGAPDGTPTTASATTKNGIVEVSLNSGTGTGTATVTASVITSTQTVIGLSNPVPIVGSRAASDRFGLAASRINIPAFIAPGVGTSDLSTTISAIATDRLGGTVGLIGNLVSFYTEAGRIAPFGNLDATGEASVAFLTGPTFPSNGRITIMAVMIGEEDFADTNGNGVYDLGEPLLDDVPEPFIDFNYNSIWNVGEDFFDNNADGVYSGPNGVWDGPGCPAPGCVANKQIWADIELVLSGAPVCSAYTRDISNGETAYFAVYINDVNGNSVAAGTKVMVTYSGAAGIFGGMTELTVPDAINPVPVSFTIADASPPPGDMAGGTADGTYTVTVAITPPASSGFAGCSTTITGTIY